MFCRMDSGETRTLSCSSGVQQEDPIVPTMFCLALRQALKRFREEFDGENLLDIRLEKKVASKVLQNRPEKCPQIRLPQKKWGQLFTSDFFLPEGIPKSELLGTGIEFVPNLTRMFGRVLRPYRTLPMTSVGYLPSKYLRHTVVRN